MQVLWWIFFFFLQKILQDPALSGIGQIIWIWLWIKQNTTFCYLVSGDQDDFTICSTPIIFHLKRSWICNISAVKECFFWPILQAKNCTSLKRAFSAYSIWKMTGQVIWEITQIMWTVMQIPFLEVLLVTNRGFVLVPGRTAKGILVSRKRIFFSFQVLTWVPYVWYDVHADALTNYMSSSTLQDRNLTTETACHTNGWETTL